MTAALGALAAPATAGAATKISKVQPVVSAVAPMTANVGDTLTLYGKNFRRGKARNSVAFKAIGQKAVFVTADISTRKQLKVVLSKKLEETMIVRAGGLVPTKFKVRVLAKRLGKRFTTLAKSPTIGPEPLSPGEQPPAPPGPPPADGDCDGDGTTNGADGDDDNDLLEDGLESTLTTDQCHPDSDGDGVQDGYEYKSAVDLNDDEYQDPNTVLPYPGKRPYANPLDASDKNVDFDGDSLTLTEEYKLWDYTGAASLTPLSYSDGEQYSASTRGADGRRKPTLAADGYDKHQQFLADASATGYYPTVELSDGPPWYSDVTRNSYALLDLNRSGDVSDPERLYYDDGDGFLSDDERDEDADGLSNYVELHGPMGPEFWVSCYGAETPYPITYDGTSHVDADTDGDGVRDGVDDQDHDDLPNLSELSRIAASGLFDGDGICKPRKEPALPEINHPDAYGHVNPFNPCLPATWARTCMRYSGFDGQPSPFSGPTWWSLN